jgi:hypothetical protein
MRTSFLYSYAVCGSSRSDIQNEYNLKSLEKLKVYNTKQLRKVQLSSEEVFVFGNQHIVNV